LAATRDGYSHRLGDAGLPQLRLRRLDPAVSAELFDASAPRVSLVVRDRLLREAAGNPLALTELSLGSAGLQRDAPMAGQLPLTERLQRAFAARVSDLPDDTLLLVLIAALIDGEDVIAGEDPAIFRGEDHIKDSHVYAKAPFGSLQRVIPWMTLSAPVNSLGLHSRSLWCSCECGFSAY
jgi:hypothetical protein